MEFRRLAGDADLPAEAIALTAADGVGLRAALWHCEGARGTVLLFPGRTEYVEKYASVAAALVAAGHVVLAIDWRGQGASVRLLTDPVPGHVEDFAHYQRDVDALRQLAEARALPRPWRLLAHSMGGAIGLRALMRRLPVAAAAFSAPMWGIRVGALPDGLGISVAARLAGAAGSLGRGQRAMPGRAGVLDIAFRDNLLTGDVDAYCRMMRQAAAWPDLMTGAASWDWVRAATAECRALARLPSPELPALIALGSEEAIVAPAAIRARADAWPGARLLALEGARHEALFEVPALRARLLDAILAFFA